MKSTIACTQSSSEVAQSNTDVCHVPAQSSWEVAQSSYVLCHVNYCDIFVSMLYYLFQVLDDVNLARIHKTNLARIHS